MFVCPVRNEAAFISRLIDSLQTQTYSDWTILIRDNSSSDETADVVRKFQAEDDRIILSCGSSPVSVYVNWLLAIEEALLIESDYVSGVAGDDYYENSTHLESLVEALQGNASCALPQFRFTSEVAEISMPTKAASNSMRRNHFLLATRGVYICAIYGLFKRGEFERILNTRSGKWPTTWEPNYDYWFSLEALRNAQSVSNETYIKYVKGVKHSSSYYNPESKEMASSPGKDKLRISLMLGGKLFETFIDPPRLFLSGYKRVSIKDLPWVPFFLFAMSATRFSELLLLSFKFVLKPNGLRARFSRKIS